MRTNRLWLPIISTIAIASATGCHRAASTDSQTPEQARQNAIAAQDYQINHSNLPPDQKQKLIDQAHASGGNITPR